MFALRYPGRKNPDERPRRTVRVLAWMSKESMVRTRATPEHMLRAREVRATVPVHVAMERSMFNAQFGI